MPRLSLMQHADYAPAVRFQPRNVSPIERARAIARSLGTYRAARYLKARGWSLEAAVHILTTPTTKGR